MHSCLKRPAGGNVDDQKALGRLRYGSERQAVSLKHLRRGSAREMEQNKLFDDLKRGLSVKRAKDG